jgi:hypothetical protein
MGLLNEGHPINQAEKLFDSLSKEDNPTDSQKGVLDNLAQYIDIGRGYVMGVLRRNRKSLQNPPQDNT